LWSCIGIRIDSKFDYLFFARNNSLTSSQIQSKVYFCGGLNVPVIAVLPIFSFACMLKISRKIRMFAQTPTTL